MSTTPFWRKINQTVSGYSRSITDDIVAEILKLSKDELVEGLLNYKSYTKKGYDDWIAVTNVSTYMNEFVHELSQDINLDANIAYPVMCNYLMFEYHGQIKEFWQITRIGTTLNLKESIWNFYTAERMFLLKTLRHIFEFVNEDYEFAEQYKAFLDSIKIEELQNKLIKQFECLLNEITPKNYDERNKRFENWLCRNSREQIEVLMILMLTVTHRSLSNSQLIQIYKLFVHNNFNAPPFFFELTKLLKPQDLYELMSAEIGCYFVILESYWDSDNADFWKNDATNQLNTSLINLHLNPGHSSIMLSWLLLRYKALKLESDEDKIMDLFKIKPFSLLSTVLSCEIFKNCTAGKLVLKAVHKMLDQVCLVWDDRDQLYEEEGVIPALSEILKQNDLAEICCQTRNGLDCLLEMAVEAFPVDFFSFTSLYSSLLKHENQFVNTMQLINNLPSFLTEMTWEIPQDEIAVLRKSQPAFSNSNLIVFPANTTVRSHRIFGANMIQYRGTYSYFFYVEYIIDVLVENAIKEQHFDDDLIKRLLAGFDLVIQGIKYGINANMEELGIERMIENLDKIIVILDGPLLNYDLVKLYFNVHNMLMIYQGSRFFNVCNEIVWKIFFPKVKAEFLNQEVSVLLFRESVFEETIFMKLLQDEESTDDHELLLTYIDILQKTIKLKFEFKHFHIAGTTYILNFVMLQHQSWTYKNNNQKTKITLACINIFHYILQQNPEELKTDDERNIFYLCRLGFLNTTFVIESFLRLFVKPKYYLIFLMERESNWHKGPALEKLHCIRMQLALLLIVMNLKKNVEKCKFNDRLPFIVKPIASFLTNSYSSIIAELSCRFLEKVAQDHYNPLLALLELDHYQVQSLFLERLRDPLEEENVKLAIIDLINTCIANQNGMTAAFFNLKCFMYWDGTDNDLFTGDSVSDFMVDYLQNIKKSHEYFKNPLQLGILRLLYNLWVNHRENLIDNIANLKDFWPVMIDPFFYDFVQDVEVYTVILKIINLEIGTNIDNVEEKLKETVDKFLKDKEQLKKWINYVLEISTSDSKDNIDLLSAWMEFLILTKKVMPEKFEKETKITIINSCLNGFSSPLTSYSNVEIVYLWCELYLMLVTSWPIYDNEEKFIIKHLSPFIHSLAVHYKYLTPKMKEVLLCIINRTIIDLEHYFNEHTAGLLSFLYSVGIIIDTEHEFLISEVWNTEDELEKISLLKPWLLIIFIGNALLQLENVKQITIWFSYRHFLTRVMNSVGYMLQHRSTLPFAKLAIDHLITYAESPLAKDFLKVDLFSFYYKVRPPVLTISVAEAILSGVPVNLKEWWLIFITLIRLNRILLINLGGTMLGITFSFIQQHDQLLKEIISLTKYTVDMTALTLVCEALKLIYILINLMPHWSVESQHSHVLIMDGVKITINACVLSILGSKKINFYKIIHGKDLDVINCPPTDLLVSVLNKLIEIIYWASSCLKKVKLDLGKIVDLHHPAEIGPLLIEIDFSVPRFELPITSKLTYGMLLCLAHYLCKTLNQLSPETPLTTPRTRQVSMTELQDEIRLKNLAKIFEHCTATYEKCIGFMVYLQRSDDLPNEKLSSFLHYDMSEFSGSSSSAISQLNYHVVKNALEALMSFLGSEIFFTLLTLDEESLFAYKRELISEMQFFYEFVRKRTGEQYTATPRSQSLPQSESDIIKRYMMTKIDDNINDVADNNFVLIISQWLVKYCQLSN